MSYTSAGSQRKAFQTALVICCLFDHYHSSSGRVAQPHPKSEGGGSWTGAGESGGGEGGGKGWGESEEEEVKGVGGRKQAGDTILNLATQSPHTIICIRWI